jgi:hypothetical protein
MSAYPSAAAELKPPPSPIDVLMKIQAYRNSQNQNTLEQQSIQENSIALKQKQQQMQDQQVFTKALADSKGDFDAALKNVSGKISGPSYQQLQETHLKTAKAIQDMDANKRAALKDTNDRLLALTQQVKQLPPDQYQAQWPQIAQAAKAIKPELQIDPSQPIPQEQISQLELGLMTTEQFLKKAEEGRKEQTFPAEKAKIQAEADKAQMEADALKQNGGMTPQMAESRYLFLQQKRNSGKPLSPDEQAAVKAYEKLKTLVPVANFNLQNAGATGQGGQPSVIAKSLADGSVKWNDVVSARTPLSVKQALLSEVKAIKPDFNSGDFAIEQSVRKDFTSGDAAKNLNAFNTAIEHAKQLDAATGDLKNFDTRILNKLGNAYGVEMGKDPVTNFNVIKNALVGEISKVFKGGQATDAEIAHLVGPFDAANSPAQLKGAVRQAIALMNSKREALQGQYDQGMKGKPNFGASNSGGKVTATGPDGHQIEVRNGVWVDSATGKPVQTK